jgi:hypothetical protein
MIIVKTAALMSELKQKTMASAENDSETREPETTIYYVTSLLYSHGESAVSSPLMEVRAA